METLSFTFGVLSVVAVIILTVIVMGIVKVLKQQNRIQSIEDHMHHAENRLDKNFQDTHRLVDDLHKQTGQRIDQLHSYVDSRIDKCEAKKQLIKD
jgi:uncharacterized protein HemX